MSLSSERENRLGRNEPNRPLFPVPDTEARGRWMASEFVMSWTHKWRKIQWYIYELGAIKLNVRRHLKNILWLVFSVELPKMRNTKTLSAQKQRPFFLFPFKIHPNAKDKFCTKTHFLLRKNASKQDFHLFFRLWKKSLANHKSSWQVVFLVSRFPKPLAEDVIETPCDNSCEKLLWIFWQICCFGGFDLRNVTLTWASTSSGALPILITFDFSYSSIIFLLYSWLIIFISFSFLLSNHNILTTF